MADNSCMDPQGFNENSGLRASDADRDTAASVINSALAEGRLTAEEHGDRLDAIYAARTHGDLVPLLADLPAAGTARAQQLAGLALREPARRAAAETAVLAVLGDPAELGKLAETGLCHGTAGLLQATWRISADAGTGAFQSFLACIARGLTAQLSRPGDGNPELMDGMAGAALALHTVGTGAAPEPCWDAFLALA